MAIENQSPINKINGQLSIGKQLKPSIKERVSIFHCHVGVLVVQVDGRHQASPTPTLPTPGWSFSGGIPSWEVCCECVKVWISYVHNCLLFGRQNLLFEKNFRVTGTLADPDVQGTCRMISVTVFLEQTELWKRPGGAGGTTRTVPFKAVWSPLSPKPCRNNHEQHMAVS